MHIVQRTGDATIYRHNQKVFVHKLKSLVNCNHIVQMAKKNMQLLQNATIIPIYSW